MADISQFLNGGGSTGGNFRTSAASVVGWSGNSTTVTGGVVSIADDEYAVIVFPSASGSSGDISISFGGNGFTIGTDGVAILENVVLTGGLGEDVLIGKTAGTSSNVTFGVITKLKQV